MADEITAENISQEKIADAEFIGKEIMKAMEAVRDKQKLMMASDGNVQGIPPSIADNLSDDIKKRLTGYDIEVLEKEGSEICALGAKEGLLTSKFGCGCCTAGFYIGLAAIIGGAIILSAGMSIPAVLAASGYSMSGLATVLAAMTGVEVGAISLMLTAAKATLGLIALGICEKMGWC
ncbi:MAG: hypothetical protein R3D71_04995 [Rickettsiales bacterium]